MLFENRKAKALAKAFGFQKTFQHQGGYSATTMRTSTLFLFYHSKKRE